MRIKNNKKKIFQISAIVVLLAIFFCYIYINKVPKQTLTHQKCPEEYSEDDAGIAEYRNTLTDWTGAYFKTHPEATMSDWSKAKLQLWIDNGCTVAIQRLKLSGNVSDLKLWEKVDYEMQTVLDKSTQ